jgi:hypothetical protein
LQAAWSASPTPAPGPPHLRLPLCVPYPPHLCVCVCAADCGAGGWQWQVEVQEQDRVWSTEVWNARLRSLVAAAVDTSGVTDALRLPRLRTGDGARSSGGR